MDILGDIYETSCIDKFNLNGDYWYDDVYWSNLSLNDVDVIENEELWHLAVYYSDKIVVNPKILI